MNLALCLSAGLLIFGQSPVVDETEMKEVLVPFWGREAQQYEFFLDKEHEQRLELRKLPVMTWTNTNQYMGAVYVWTYGGRPEVIGCIGSANRGLGKFSVFHELHSLSTQPMESVPLAGGKERWNPNRPGIVPKIVEDAPVPSDSERLRLTQMRNIAREFSGYMKDGNDVTELRLLPQPLVRYSAPERGVVDGAIFAFVWKGTDPEILLILEDRKGKTDEQWCSAVARFNYREMWLKRNDKEEWRAQFELKNDIYISRTIAETTLTEIRSKAPKEE